MWKHLLKIEEKINYQNEFMSKLMQIDINVILLSDEIKIFLEILNIID